MTEPDGRAPEETTEALDDDAADQAEAGADAAEEADFESAEAREADFGDGDGDGEDEDQAGAVTPGAGVGAAAAAGTAAAGGRGRRGRPGTATPEHVQTASDRAVHIDDRIPKFFVAGVAVVFAVIILNALFLGQGGLFAPVPTPTPISTAAPGASASPAGSSTPAPSGSAAPGASAGPSALRCTQVEPGRIAVGRAERVSWAVRDGGARRVGRSSVSPAP